jgi:hypothetical protein
MAVSTARSGISSLSTGNTSQFITNLGGVTFQTTINGTEEDMDRFVFKVQEALRVLSSG